MEQIDANTVNTAAIVLIFFFLIASCMWGASNRSHRG
jgi:hypothetical protein